MQKDLFAVPVAIPPQEFESEPFLVLEIPGRLPSWNEILGMHHWQRYKFKEQLARDFLCALRACARDFSMKTTSAKNIMSIFADTLERSLEIKRAKRRSKLRSKRLAQKNRSSSELKFSESDVPFLK